MNWTATAVIHYMTWINSSITNCRFGIVCGVGVLLIITKLEAPNTYVCIHVYIIYIHIWEVVALCGTQANYDYGGE